MDKVIAISADVFIVPNKSRVVKDYPTYIRTYFKKVAKLNNIAITNIDKIVEVWFLTPDIDNLTNGFDMEIEGIEYCFNPAELAEVPAEIFNDVKEGDVIKYSAPVKATDPSGKEVNMVFEITMTCQQTGYRYGSLGTFEEVLRKMTHDKDEDIQVPKNISIATSNLNEIAATTEEVKEVNGNLNYNKMKRGNSKMENQTVNISANVFIIPNPASPLKMYNNYTKKYLLDLVKVNKVDLGIEDKIVEVCFSNKDLDSNNFAEDGLTVVVDGYTIDVAPYNLIYVPAKILEGAKEGDVITYKAPAKAYVSKVGQDVENKEITIVLNISMTCNQKDSAYAKAGTFEEVFKTVTSTKTETAAKETKEENKKEEEKSIMKSIKERWNNLPKGVKTGAKIVAGVAVVAAVAYVGNEGYKKYIKKDDVVIESDVVIVTDDIDEVTVDDDDDNFIVVVSE